MTKKAKKSDQTAHPTEVEHDAPPAAGHTPVLQPPSDRVAAARARRELIEASRGASQVHRTGRGSGHRGPQAFRPAHGRGRGR